MKTEGYKVIRNSVNQLSLCEEEINKLIKEGWELHGTLVIAKLDKHEILIQPMVKYKSV